MSEAAAAWALVAGLLFASNVWFWARVLRLSSALIVAARNAEESCLAHRNAAMDAAREAAMAKGWAELARLAAERVVADEDEDEPDEDEEDEEDEAEPPLLKRFAKLDIDPGGVR